MNGPQISGAGNGERVPTVGLAGRKLSQLVPFIPTLPQFCSRFISTGHISVSGWMDLTSGEDGNFAIPSQFVPLCPVSDFRSGCTGLATVFLGLNSGQIQLGPPALQEHVRQNSWNSWYEGAMRLGKGELTSIPAQLKVTQLVTRSVVSLSKERSSQSVDGSTSSCQRILNDQPTDIQ